MTKQAKGKGKADGVSALIGQARGGRVVRSGFIDAGSIDRRALAEDSELRFSLAGGFPDASRVVLTLHPAHIPEVDSGVQVFAIEGLPPSFDEQDAAVALRGLGLSEAELGEVRLVRGVVQLAATGKAAEAIAKLSELSGHEISVEPLGESAAKGSKTREVVVPSLRVDVVGARGFGVSRAYFQQGIDGGKVTLNGQPVRAGAEIREGDSLSAQGLGRVDFKRVVSETRRGNYKLELEVHR